MTPEIGHFSGAVYDRPFPTGAQICGKFADVADT